MPNVIDQTGIQIQTLAQILDEILNGTADYPGMYQIYGPNINVEPNSPDGQMVNIIAQAKLDMLEFISQVFASFDPDQAVGRLLDQRCAINGVVRNAGTYTVTNVTVVATQAVTLVGIDTSPDAPFTVADGAGNQFQLVTTHVFSGADTQVLVFQAKNLGLVETTPNTITTIVTVTLGIATVNNPTVATSIGEAEETDYALRIRRARSVSLPSKGYFEGLYGALLDTTGVTSVNLLENITSTVDGNGIPGHSIWAIVAGGTDAAVAHAIYLKRNGGCGMKGGVTVAVAQIDGSSFEVMFDRPILEDLWITLNVAAITGVVDVAYIRTQLLAALSYQIGQSADTTTIVSLVRQISSNASVSSEGVSDANAGYVALKAPTGVNYQFVPASARIIINGSPGP